MGSAILTTEIASRAVSIVKAAFLAAAELKVIHGNHFHIVVMDPTVHPWSGVGFGDAILYQASFGPREQWAYPYDHIARAKAAASWSTGGCPTDYVQRLAPHLYERNHVKWPGSAVYRGLIVAASGAQPWFDAAFAGCVAHLCVAMSIEEMETRVLPSEGIFLSDVTPTDSEMTDASRVPRPGGAASA